MGAESLSTAELRRELLAREKIEREAQEAEKREREAEARAGRLRQNQEQADALNAYEREANPNPSVVYTAHEHGVTKRQVEPQKCSECGRPLPRRKS